MRRSRPVTLYGGPVLRLAVSEAKLDSNPIKSFPVGFIWEQQRRSCPPDGLASVADGGAAFRIGDSFTASCNIDECVPTFGPLSIWKKKNKSRNCGRPAIRTYTSEGAGGAGGNGPGPFSYLTAFRS